MLTNGRMGTESRVAGSASLAQNGPAGKPPRPARAAQYAIGSRYAMISAVRARNGGGIWIAPPSAA